MVNDPDDDHQATPADGPVFAKVADRLRQASIDFEVSRHAPVYTSAEAAAIRGVDLHSGAKALIIKAGDRFVMIVLPADLSLNGKAVKKALACKSTRFANQDEVLRMTGLTPGAIPPFGSLFDLGTFCDERLADNEWINFNAGAHTVSIGMSYADYLAVEQPTLGRFAAP
ncbi:MAG: aminoacyl-tRNA deacylase [Phycisphaerae bacterium]